ncbi:hypothetical protein F4781DRAFT_3014 [Annulohypoxylon bovei var. microspora]|nr:hypothetical protein F4781DRAFT_3014 [Annulohypoxylon bovei var. microspora]
MYLPHVSFQLTISRHHSGSYKLISQSTTTLPFDSRLQFQAAMAGGPDIKAADSIPPNPIPRSRFGFGSPATFQAPRIYRFTATALGASMWFFLMYRAKKDGAVLMGWKHPWDH